jgi:hypothetical protein
LACITTDENGRGSRRNGKRGVDGNQRGCSFDATTTARSRLGICSRKHERNGERAIDDRNEFILGNDHVERSSEKFRARSHRRRAARERISERRSIRFEAGSFGQRKTRRRTLRST